MWKQKQTKTKQKWYSTPLLQSCWPTKAAAVTPISSPPPPPPPRRKYSHNLILFCSPSSTTPLSKCPNLIIFLFHDFLLSFTKLCSSYIINKYTPQYCFFIIDKTIQTLSTQSCYHHFQESRQHHTIKCKTPQRNPLRPNDTVCLPNQG